MDKILVTFLGLTACAGMAQASHIQTTTLGATGRSAGVRTDSATPMEQGRWSVGLNFEHSGFDQLGEQELLDLRAADPEASLHSLDSITSMSLDVSYGLTPDISVGLHLPYIVRSDIIEAAHEHEEVTAAPGPTASRVTAAQLAGLEALGKSSGLGDLTIYGLWRFYESKATDTNFGLIAGVKMPTGVDDNATDTDETFETEFQPGSGSWDPFAGFAWSRSLGRFNLAASTIYTSATEGTANTDLGDQWTYNVGTGYGLGSFEGTNWSLVLELNGGQRDREQVDGVTDANSGGSWLLLSPGFTVTGHDWSVYASWGYPIDDTLNGNQDDLGNRFLVGVQFMH